MVAYFLNCRSSEDAFPPAPPPLYRRSFLHGQVACYEKPRRTQGEQGAEALPFAGVVVGIVVRVRVEQRRRSGRMRPQSMPSVSTPPLTRYMARYR